ncbi:ribosomal protein S5 domain 2-type protein [Endogone sp. FLAS-F59071]|nr:ribosomal protein S5 domain 2-type protein [Endogone sp. FLAS-F59071]|eukprot:RUS17511.1 ribosomal protein S5 domain 2-type protein [Endogone sp. FLAS-F59071]
MTVRPDRRTEATQLRPFSTSQNLLNRCDGSAQFQFVIYSYPLLPFNHPDKTAVLVSVTGPAEVRLRAEHLDRANIEVIVRPLTGLPSTKERVLESILRSTFAKIILAGLHPRTSVQIVAQVMKDDGCVMFGTEVSRLGSLKLLLLLCGVQVLSAAINASTMALIDAGIPMNAVVGSVTCMIGEENEILMDPTMEELNHAKSIHTFAFDNASRAPAATDDVNGMAEISDIVVLYSESTGDYTEDEYLESLSLCHQATHKVHAFIRTAIEKKIERENQQLIGR